MLSGCCHKIVVQGGGDAKAKQSDIFATYTKETGLMNGHVHYTSIDGTMAIAFSNQHNVWKIQESGHR